MENNDENSIKEMDVRRTRSGRAVRSAPPSTVTKNAGRKKKKMVLVEVEVSDEEEGTEHPQDNKTTVTDSCTVELENSDNATEAIDIHSQYQNNDFDSCSNTAQFPEESNNINNEMKSFKGAISSSEVNNTAVQDCETEEPTVESMVYEDTSSQQNNDSVTGEQNSKMDESDSKIENERMETTTINDAENETQNTLKEESMDTELQLDSDATADTNQGQSKLEGVEPDTEVISEDELPGVQVAKVPETEEVSDEELPGPKRAELPADTEASYSQLNIDFYLQ
ncbi:hypothetical protein FQR65_LT09604 [Abscondita terminalis]|nr:hypothetical protein FQR65_LT09604 [Abscondita terminalis]